MPGLVGIVTRLPQEQVREKLARMVATLRHRPDYVTGMCMDETMGVYTGWAARPGSFAAQLPLVNETGELRLFFSGEEFPAPDTLAGLQARGHSVDPQPAGYLVHVAEEDAAFPAGLNGRFHGLLADRRSGTATLFNDRYGMHRIYYHQSADAFYFAAEAKAILAVCPHLRVLDSRALGEFVSCGCVLENRTLFQGIEALPPGSAWTLRGGGVETRGQYFHPREWEEQGELSEEAYYTQLREVFTRNLPRYFSGTQDIGISLTGGLDTRMIMAWLPREREFPCYSFAGMFRDCEDVTVARKVAAAHGQTHQIIPVADEFLKNFGHYAERSVYLTDGCLPVNHSADLYVNERAAAIAPVRMTGNYGGEVLRRVRAFKPMALTGGMFSRELDPLVETARHSYQSVIDTHPLSFAVFRQAPWHHYGLQALEQTQVTLRSPFLDNDLVRTVFRAPASACRTSDTSLRLIADGSAAMAAIPTDRGKRLGKAGPLDRAAAGLLEFTAKAEYAYDYGMPPWLARIDHILRPLHPERLFLGRHKFYHYRVWYRDFLGGYVKEILLDPRTLARPFFERKTIEAMVGGHVGGGENHTLGIHKALTLELIHRGLLETGGSA